jgi:hypothetical protein
MKLRLIAVLLLGGVCLLSGCEVLLFGGAIAGGATGSYVWINEELKTDYPASFDRTWVAVEKTVAGMRGTQVEPVKEISQGTINAVIDDEKVRIYVSYKEKNLTSVAIRVGVVGNRLASQRLLDHISENLKK